MSAKKRRLIAIATLAIVALLITTGAVFALGNFATVGGGENNTAEGDWATVSGGKSNKADGNFGTVSGGRGNTASKKYSTVGGGKSNAATGTSATVGGGNGNSATKKNDSWRRSEQQRQRPILYRAWRQPQHRIRRL